MEYFIVSANRWTDNLSKQFGCNNSEHAINEADALTFIQVFGPARVAKTNGQWTIHFEN